MSGLPLLCTRIGDNRLGIGSETIRKIRQYLQWCHFAGRRSPICEGDNNVVLKCSFDFPRDLRYPQWTIIIDKLRDTNRCASTISPPHLISVCGRFIIVKCFLLLHHPLPAFIAGVLTKQCGTSRRCFLARSVNIESSNRTFWESVIDSWNSCDQFWSHFGWRFNNQLIHWMCWFTEIFIQSTSPVFKIWLIYLYY